MSNKFVAKSTVTINATPAKVWEALTTPALIKEYLFGTSVVTNWQVGSPIIYQGTWEGKTYEDKGIILQFVPEKIFESTYWSSMGGTPDLPENYKKVTYELEPSGNQTVLTITQDNNDSEEGSKQSEGNWSMVLTGLKKLVEK